MEIFNNQFNLKIQQAISNYESRSRVLFNYLKEQSKIGWTKPQFLLYRDNYFFRTYETIECVAKVIISAKRHEDFITLRSAGNNCYEESGSNTYRKSHLELLLYSHNRHSERIFGIQYISLRDSLGSPHILEETKAFRKSQIALYESSNHVEVLAANYAQEAAATTMLTVFMKSFFEPYKNYYSNKEYQEITEYFHCHLEGLEERHADEAKYCLFQQCYTPEDIEIAIASISTILTAQSNMWVALKEKLQSITIN